MTAEGIYQRKYQIMGVVNVTPDSFSDGGRFLSPDKAVEAALRLRDAGADVVDLGAESTRPGATPVAEDEEWARLEPVLKALVGKVELSVDTRKPGVMRKAAAVGVRFVNDVGAGLGADDATLAVLARIPGMRYCAMHAHGTPETMQQSPLHGPAAVAAVDAFFTVTVARLARAGFTPDRVYLDPGVGFGKDDAGNLALLGATKRWADTGRQLLLGISRKGFIGRALQANYTDAANRDGPSKMLELGLWISGARMIRTHDVERLARLRDLLLKGEGT